MIIGAHAVIASNDAAADHKFFTEVFGLTSVDAGGGYMILGLPASEASVHPSDGEVPRNELFFLCDDVDKFVAEMTEKQVECDPIHDAGWGRVVKIKLPSGAPLNVYEPRHARP
jgi:hypothetical protein